MSLEKPLAVLVWLSPFPVVRTAPRILSPENHDFKVDEGSEGSRPSSPSFSLLAGVVPGGCLLPRGLSSAALRCVSCNATGTGTTNSDDTHSDNQGRKRPLLL